MSAFNEIINSDQPVLVDFFAEWCGSCKVVEPTVSEIYSEVKGKARILKVDIDKNPAVSLKYGIKAVPTFILFKKGEIKWQKAGVQPKDELLQIISKYF